jgi:hypothetical protein
MTLQRQAMELQNKLRGKTHEVSLLFILNYYLSIHP